MPRIFMPRIFIPRIFKLSCAVLLCALAGACAQKPAPTINEVRIFNTSFACDGGMTVHTRFATGTAVLETGGTSVAMTQYPTADGFGYAGGGQDIRGKGQAMTWRDAKGKVRQCKEVFAPNR